MNLSNWRIGYRLGIGFSLLVLMLLIVGVMSLGRLADFNTQIDRIVSSDYPLTVKGNQLIGELNGYALSQQRVLLTTSEQNIKKEMESMKQRTVTVSALMEELRKSANDTRSQAILQEINQARGDFHTSSTKFAGYINAGDTAAALNEFMTATEKSIQAYKAAISAFIDHRDDQMSVSQQQVAQSYTNTRLLLVGMILAAILVSVIVAAAITRSVTHPLNEALSIAERVSTGDLTSDILVTRKDETGLLLQALRNMNDSLRHIVSQVRDGAESISSAAGQIAAGNQDLSARTEEQASSLEQTASSMEQLTATIKNTADNTTEATQLAAQGSQTVRESGELMNDVTTEMRGIRESSQRMAEIIGVIDSIAFQTNILALNAAVEAARAGEQGRGFAVVASEVRALAQRSATAAKEIKELIDGSVEKVRQGMVLVEKTAVSMQTLVTNVEGVNGIVTEIAQASREQSDGVNQINLAVGQIDTTTQQNAALVEESAAAALSLQEQAQALTSTVSIFKLGSYHEGPVAHQETLRMLPGA
ncbi:methyl-accepting chemotaxis protein [Symbiopectobacterium purcellii]|uniref:MCP four helix bundle domain-containing protein n=1 Tax=Symbiopectobacterium purcellii TaxID=2871826 RepID=A0ABX9AGI0_9ENTR|nr:methyl-accepting chemotaxis protein [Symbiopectobacterium purcellii]QZN94267.1 MCP four helix bundle domain-containing protein [Symbiopectobacterium purcellii]